ncbi:hypothetical protein PoB_006007700 [Plakobranchus ocellatus]|uniref:Uncharacterized protein n=1 Tax=Plakobranchus ocellatus TaxID=259542 RepID=A0AAV4CNW1_9GAST|nr:hypothetical protein PoB_006007700 [Plakobranchus ocellatus]
MDAENVIYALDDSPDASSDEWETDFSEESDDEDNSPLKASTTANGNIPPPPCEKSYGATDDGPDDPIPLFKPARTPGLCLFEELETRQDRRKFLSAGEKCSI